MAVIGIGLNVNANAEEIFSEGISMQMVTGQDYDREKILGEVLTALEQGLAPFYGTSEKAHA